uniref:Gag protein n=1 Tax=Hyaloperonospora arabidopsidis (strain Emoy2) TaxID=559515 RepID=M4BU32_HYAAE
MEKLTASLGPEYVEFLVSQGPEVLTARVEGFLQYEASLLGQVQDQMASAMPTRYVSVPDEEARHRPLRVKVKNYTGKEGENLILWIREIEMAMRSGLIKLDDQQVSLAISKLDGRARGWALTCSTCFHHQTRLTAPCDYIHGESPTGIARTEVFRVHPSTFEEAVRISLNGEHNFKSARLGWNGYNPSSARANSTSTLAVNRPETMDLSCAEDEGEVELQAAEQQRVTAPVYESTLYPEPEVWHGTGNADTQ